MGQAEVIEFLKSADKPLTAREISEQLDESYSKISKDLHTLLKWGEVSYIVIDKDTALRSYGCKRRLKLFFLSKIELDFIKDLLFE